jgi:hypothetical protein
VTPQVRDILIDARKAIHGAIANHARLGDTNALFTIDNLLTADALRSSTPGLGQADLTCSLSESEAHDRPTEKLPRADDELTRLRAELAARERELSREKDLRAADSIIIRGLQAKLEDR